MRMAPANAPVLERLAASLAAAQHTPKPRAEKRLVIVAAGDHGAGDPGIAMGADHPTVLAARAIADGSAALCQVTRAANTTIVLVDAGSREPSHMPGIAIQLGRGPSHDLMREPAMTIVDASLGLDAGIALSISLGEQTPDVLALGAIGVGSEVASAAILAGITGRAPSNLSDDVAEAAGHRGLALHGAGALEILATFGGSDTAVLAGLILGAASVNVPVILDSYATGAAALIANAFAPHVAGYLVAAHRGSFTHPAILEHLGLQPAFEVGLGHGEGTGAAMVLPLLDQVAALASRS
jgi:nicotinate-nucleotide--dimethylbenzimidazole phosphoribosyltransferase